MCPLIIFDPIGDIDEQTLKDYGIELAEAPVGPLQQTPEQLQADSAAQRETNEQDSEFIGPLPCNTRVSETIPEPTEGALELLAPPEGTISTTVQIIPGEPWKENRPKPNAFGELPDARKELIPKELTFSARRTTHSLVVPRLKAMNEAWKKFAKKLVDDGGALTVQRNGKTSTTTEYTNILVASARRDSPLRSGWEGNWLLDISNYESKYNKQISKYKTRFANVKTDGKFDIAKSEAANRLKTRFRNRKPSTLEDKEFLWDGYLADRYGSTAKGRRIKAFFGNHHVGTGLDFECNGIQVNSRGDIRTAMKQTTFFKWLQENAHIYGFTPYKGEEWHWELLLTREAFFTGIDFVQDGNYNVRVVEKGTLSNYFTSFNDEALNRKEGKESKPFLKEYQLSNRGIA